MKEKSFMKEYPFSLCEDIWSLFLVILVFGVLLISVWAQKTSLLSGEMRGGVIAISWSIFFGFLVYSQSKLSKKEEENESKDRRINKREKERKDLCC